MEFCYNNNKILFISAGVGAVVSFITNIWFIYNLKCKKKIIKKTKCIEMTDLNKVTDESQNIRLNIKEHRNPEFNAESLPDWVKTEYKSHSKFNVIV